MSIYTRKKIGDALRCLQIAQDAKDAKSPVTMERSVFQSRNERSRSPEATRTLKTSTAATVWS